MVAGLTVALVPLGVTYLRGANRPSRRTVMRMVPLIMLFFVSSIIIGQLG